MEYFTVVRPQSITAEGLLKVLESGLQGLGINEISAENCKKLVGIGTDGASANTEASELKGLVEGHLRWVFWMWCMAHRLELAIKDATKATAFDLIDDLLLRLHYLYEKSLKKCRELQDIITDLKECSPSMMLESSQFVPMDLGGLHEASCLKIWGHTQITLLHCLRIDL